jgi:hypothetical protein
VDEVVMRARDIRAIGFCVITTTALFAVSLLLLHSYLAALGLTAAYAAWILTRPRMTRLLHRLRGDPDWSGYFDNGGHDGGRRDRLSRRAPGGPVSPPRPAERR